jgi:hypothetical protein
MKNCVNNEYNNSGVTVNIDDCTSEISVIVDSNVPNISPLANLINQIILDYGDLSIIKTLTGNWQETYHEVNIMQPLSSNWDETYFEVNTMQDSLTSNWDEAYNFVHKGVVDGGFF